MKAIYRREPGYLDNPARQSLWRNGHAHAGVLVTPTLTGVGVAGTPGRLATTISVVEVDRVKATE